MNFSEMILFAFSAVFVCIGMTGWYGRLIGNWKLRKDKTVVLVFTFLPIIAIAIILYTLRYLASFDVADDFLYILFYLLLGIAWVHLGLKLIFRLFDLSWTDDALNNNNKAALFAISGAYVGLVFIYSGANVGDGPGWWHVIFAGGFGLAAWIILGIFIGKITQVFERITVDRDINCGIRTGFYFLASGVILGKASAGDWVSFSRTILELSAGWPAIILALLAVIVEHQYVNLTMNDEGSRNNYSLSRSVFWAIVYIVLAVFSTVLFPLFDNLAYGNVPISF